MTSYCIHVYSNMPYKMYKYYVLTNKYFNEYRAFFISSVVEIAQTQKLNYQDHEQHKGKEQVCTET